MSISQSPESVNMLPYMAKRTLWTWLKLCGCYVQLLQSCPTLCSPMDSSLPGSNVHGILQARMLEWVAVPSSRGSSWLRDWIHISCIADRFFTTEPLGKPKINGSDLPAMQETWVWSLGWEDPLEKETASHPSILAWRIPWTKEPGGLQSMGSQRVGHDWATNTFFSFMLDHLGRRNLIMQIPKSEGSLSTAVRERYEDRRWLRQMRCSSFEDRRRLPQRKWPLKKLD